MTRGLYKPRAAGSLKDAVAELVVACGGQAASAQLTRVSKSQMARYTDDSGENALCAMPVDIVLVLEAHCGEPVVTRYLAAAQKKIILDFCGYRDAFGAVDKASDKLAQVAGETGKLLADAMRAIEHNRFEAKKSPRIRKEALETIYALSRLLESLPQ